MEITGHLRPGRPKKGAARSCIDDTNISTIHCQRHEQEDDESYRYRINLKLQSKGGSAEGDLRLAVLQIPGVQDVEFEREAGTYNAYIYGVAPNVPASLLQLVQEQLDQRTAYTLVGLEILPRPAVPPEQKRLARGREPGASPHRGVPKGVTARAYGVDVGDSKRRGFSEEGGKF